jgi:hypothetical protein
MSGLAIYGGRSKPIGKDHLPNGPAIAKNSGQVEGWNQILDKVAAVVAGLAQAK